MSTGKRLLLARIESLQQTRLLLLILSSCGKLPSEFMTPQKKILVRQRPGFIYIEWPGNEKALLFLSIYLFLFLLIE